MFHRIEWEPRPANLRQHYENRNWAIASHNFPVINSSLKSLTVLQGTDEFPLHLCSSSLLPCTSWRIYTGLKDKSYRSTPWKDTTQTVEELVHGSQEDWTRC